MSKLLISYLRKLRGLAARALLAAATTVATILIIAGMPVTSYATEETNPPEEVVVDQAQEPDLDSLDLAYGAYQRGLYLTAFNLALPRANDGDAAAQTLIAELYEKGLGVARDTKEAAAWYEIAANSGNREAQFAYGLKLLKGIDVPQDVERGHEMMAVASDAGHPIAMFNRAQQLIDERPTGLGYRNALPLLEAAAERGVADAYYSLFQIYRDGLANGIQDPVKARHWLVRAARAGVEGARVELGVALARGEGGPRNLQQAANWFKLAANAGNVIAQNRLAHLLVQLNGSDDLIAEAAMWHILARRAGRNDLELDQFLLSLDDELRSKALSMANQWPAIR